MSTSTSLSVADLLAAARAGAPQPLGRLFAKDSASYRYLAESIRKHPDQATLKAMMETAGLERVDVRNLSAGIVAIHRGYRV